VPQNVCDVAKGRASLLASAPSIERPRSMFAWADPAELDTTNWLARARLAFQNTAEFLDAILMPSVESLQPSEYEGNVVMPRLGTPTITITVSPEGNGPVLVGTIVVDNETNIDPFGRVSYTSPSQF